MQIHGICITVTIEQAMRYGDEPVLSINKMIT